MTNMDFNSIKATELTLGLPGSDHSPEVASPMVEGKSRKRPRADDDPVPPPAKAQVVGWPPVRAFRKNCLSAKKPEGEAEGMYVKVSMDGAPYLRKVDVKMYQGYKELIKALEAMFKCFIIGDLSSKESCNKGDQFALTYEDKDGDWMLVGDVPFEMFTSSCKRLRIMRKSEAQGLGSSLL